jgi:hypothetical protein
MSDFGILYIYAQLLFTEIYSFESIYHRNSHANNYA